MSGIKHQTELWHACPQSASRLVLGHDRRRRAQLRLHRDRSGFGQISQRTAVLGLTGFPDFNNQPVRVRPQADRKVGSSCGLKHHPAYALGRLRDTNSRQACVADLDRLAEHARRQRGIVQVNVNPFRRTQAVGFILNFALHIDDDGTGVIG